MSYDLNRLQGDVAQVQHADAGFGSGRLVAEDLILTAAHTLWNGETGPFLEGWQVRLARDRSTDAWGFRHGNRVVWHNRGLDLALIKVLDLRSGPLRPELRLRVATVTWSNPHSVEARGYPRASKQPNGHRELTHAFGRLTAAQQDQPLHFGVDQCDLPNTPHADWPGISGSLVLLRDGPNPDEICVYGVVKAVPERFNGQLTVARLAEAWRDAAFRNLLVAAGAPNEDAKDPSRTDVGDASASFRALRHLIRNVPAAADAVSRSKEAIENTSQDIEKLEVFKAIHDGLHIIEFECLRPLKAMKSAGNPLLHRGQFERGSGKIQEFVEKSQMPSLLRDDLAEGLESTAAAFQATVDEPGEAARVNLLGQLDRLLAGVSPRLADAISMTAKDLRLDHIVELMTTVQRCLPAAAEPAIETTVEDLIRGIDALRGMHEELARRVSEHGHLQRLDSKLRAMCGARLGPGTLAKDWERAKRYRSDLKPPFSAEMGRQDAVLKALESAVEAALVRSDEQAALDQLNDYFQLVSFVFRDVDSRLKEFTLKLGRLSPSLRLVLSEAEGGGSE